MKWIADSRGEEGVEDVDRVLFCFNLIAKIEVYVPVLWSYGRM